jgi:DNA polymerase
MRWTILTPDASVSWDLEQLQYTGGVEASAAPRGDELEVLWKTYYAAIFNPARMKTRAMKKEMPVRHWATLPEAELIDDLLRQAAPRVETFMPKAHAKPAVQSAAEFVPKSLQLLVLKKAAAQCKGCELYCNATQVVFGQGPDTAGVMFVGEQPGDKEDIAGQPFVGPAGQMLDGGLEKAGIDRGEVYVTNAVKHFKFEQRGTRRIHAKPNAREMSACRPWLEAEIASVRPKLIVCLGATAAQTLMGPQFRITRDRGKIFADTEWAPAVIATNHPSAILRMPDEQSKKDAYEHFVGDLQIVQREMNRISRDSANESAKRHAKAAAN